MSKHFVRFVAMLLMGSMLVASSGCFASFNLTRKIYKFNQGLGDKWLNEIAFLVMTIIPVYGVGFTVDALVLNSIEFWGGTNPVSASNDQKTIPIPEAGVTLTLNAADKSIRLLQDLEGTQKEYVFERSGDETIVKDGAGNVLVRCAATEDGGIVLKDASGKMISSYSNEDLANISQRLSAAN
jgi:hypothetical protein